MSHTDVQLVSVVIPCYNYAHFLHEAIDSCLEQADERLNVEIIVVDDGSTDNTDKVAKGYGSKIRYVHQKNQGLSAARNTGIRESCGDFLVFLDADDLLDKGTLISHLEQFASRPELDISVCPCMYKYLNSNGQDDGLWLPVASHLDLHLCQSNIAPVHSFMVRSSAIHEAGFFDTSLSACEDQDYWLRCAAIGKRFGATGRGSAVYRRHCASMTANSDRQFAHDIAMRYKTRKLLETVPDFPRAGKYWGWLACAAGTLGSAGNILDSSPALVQKLLEEVVSALFLAARNASRTDDPHLFLAQEYFASLLFYGAGLFSEFKIKNQEKAFAALAKLFPHLANLDLDAQKGKQVAILRKLRVSQK